MSALSAFGHFRRLAILTAMVAVLCVRGALPAGYMPDRSAEDGSLIIRICGGLDERFMRLDPETGRLTPIAPGEAPAETPGEDGDAGHGSCPFALTAAFDLPPPARDLSPPAFRRLQLASRPYHPPIARRPAAAPPPPRGPPFTA